MKAINIFFDTEFTDINPMKTPALISIGVVAPDGREFYAELIDTYTRDMCSAFVIKNVLPLLDDGDCRLFVVQLAVRLKDWIESLGDEKVILHSDSPSHDWPLIANVFNEYGWPANLLRKCEEISFESSIHLHRFKVGQMNFWKANGTRRHHALVDARSHQFAWKQATRRGF
jgi:hypothetical protein